MVRALASFMAAGERTVEEDKRGRAVLATWRELLHGGPLRRMTVAVKPPSVAAASSALRCALLFAGCTAPPSARVQALLGMVSQGEADACLE